MIYLDSSYIFKCYINEPGTREVLSLVQNSVGCGSGLHARAEFWSGLHRRVCEMIRRSETLIKSGGSLNRMSVPEFGIGFR